MLALNDALSLLLDGVRALGPELVPIGDCHGRVLWSDVVAGRDQPPEPVSAMDGYAIRAEKARAGATFTVIGESPAGRPFERPIGDSEAVRIATGGVLPPGSDHVLVQEHAEPGGSVVRVREWSSPPPPSHVRPVGMDFTAGDNVAQAGDVLTPARHALVAAANVASVPVARRPLVSILSSGDELREPGDSLVKGQTVNSAAYALMDLVERWGGQPRRAPILPDDRAVCEAGLLAESSNADIVVTIGGASVGDRDLWRPLVKKSGGELIFEGIAVQPGKPTWHARLKDGTLVLGLPGNPASAFVCAHLLLKPLLFRLAGRDPLCAFSSVAARLDQPLEANGRREAFLRAHVLADAKGQLRAEILSRQDSSLLAPLAASNALVRRPPGAPAAAKGKTVEVLMIE